MSSSSPPIRKPAAGPKNRASISKSSSILLYVVISILLVTLICTILTILAITSVVPMPHLGAFLSSFLKYFLAITAPFLPFYLAGLVGYFMKVWKRRAFGGRTTWLLILGGQVGQHFGRVVGESMDMGKVFTAWGGEGVRWDELLLGMRGWVQWGLIVFVVWGEIMGRRWDGGYVEKLVDGLVKEEEEKLKEKMIADEEMGVEVGQEVEVGGDGNGDVSSEKDSEKVSLL
jgi:hypothetical protein